MPTITTQPTVSGETDKPSFGDRILIVDDESAILFAYRRLIEREGIEVDVCESYDEAIEHLKDHLYIAVIADMRLAGSDNTDGLELLRVIRKERPDTKVILATGFGNSEIKQTALALGASYYFEKPVMPSIIMDLLKSMCLAANGIFHEDLPAGNAGTA